MFIGVEGALHPGPDGLANPIQVEEMRDDVSDTALCIIRRLSLAALYGLGGTDGYCDGVEGCKSGRHEGDTATFGNEESAYPYGLTPESPRTKSVLMAKTEAGITFDLNSN